MDGSGAKLMASTSAATITIESTPPRLSTDSVVSLTCAGIRRNASTSAIAASGSVMMNTEPHQKWPSRKPAASGPMADMAPPIADHRAIERVRDGPDHSAVIRARVVG